MFEAILNRIKPSNAENKTEKEIHGYNPYLLSEIQSQGGIRFDEAYIRKGDGYETCIHVYDFQTIVSDFWLEQIMNMPNVVASLDVSTPNRKEIMDSLNKSMAEQKVRGENAKETSDLIEASQSYDELQDIYNEIRQGEVMKRIILRLFVSAKTIVELERTVKEVIDTLESLNFRGTVFLNELEYEWDGMFTSFDTQQKYPNKRRGVEIPSLSLAGGFPFHFTSLNDPYGTHYGTTDTNGNVIFDLFHKDQKRKFYNALMIGKMGSGKSTLLKKVALDKASKGHKVRILDITGEFEDLVLKHDGKVIALDGSNGLINPLQVYKTATNDDGSANEQLSFTQHLSKMSVFYRFLNPDATNAEIKEYENLLRTMYVEHELWIDGQNNNITDRKVDEYPIFSDFLKHLRKELYEKYEERKVHENIGIVRRERLENIELNISNLVQNYAHLFDGHSSIEQFDNEYFVSFPLRNLSELKPEIFQAQLFNVMNMLWDGMLINGQPQLQAYTKHQLSFEDAVRYLILIDEAHHIINTRKGSEHGVQYLQRFMREARKYFGGIFFASHLITDFVPENADQSSAEEVKKLFSLTQYKFIGEQDSESLNKLKEVFTGQLNDSELSQIPYLQQGQVLLSISSVKNIKMNVDVSLDELELFGGGA
ncbi:VirB4 family type IV secretion system protein [Virgibacillus salexigens]|uniref:VirB4 family type IV secretion system protein n=1 Tax=Virgibacillus massiliensis TaxID=1462526 RepID=UPI00136DCE50|nr:type IV secretion system protein VirB4 [Virgibacillus massiliensis]MYL43965.1 type IV secretion system protein VirB4 [Virgibacillus massiliensis]